MSKIATTDACPVYEAELADSPAMVLREAESLYEGRGRLQRTYERLAGEMNRLGIGFCLLGGYALILHGVRRFTEDIDVLIREADVRLLRDELLGKGYVSVPGAVRSLRDAVTGVRIDLVLSGHYPGDGRPKPVAFPDPSSGVEDRNRIRVVSLRTLIELKLASGMTAADRLQDLADVQRLIRVHGLREAFAEELHPYVRERFRELARGVEGANEEK